MRPRILAILSSAMLAAHATGAAAEDQEKRFTIHPSLQLTWVVDDDPYLDDGNETEVGYWFAPKVELGYRAESYELGMELGGDIRRYWHDDSLSEAFWRIRATGEAGILPGLTVRFSEAYTPQPERIAAPGDETRNLIQTNQVDAEIRYWRELPERRELLMTFRGSHFSGEKFDATLLTDGGGIVPFTDFRPDHWEGAADLEVQTPFGARTSLYSRVQLRYRTFSESVVTDQGEVILLVGARTRRFRNIELDAAIGWGLIAFKSRDSVRRFVGEGSLRYRLPNGWSWRVSAANRFVLDASGHNFVETTGRMGIQKFISDLVSVSLAAFVSRLENDAWGTAENLFGGGEVRLRGQIARYTQLSLTYRHWVNGGDYSVDDFNQDRVALEITFRR